MGMLKDLSTRIAVDVFHGHIEVKHPAQDVTIAFIVYSPNSTDFFFDYVTDVTGRVIFDHHAMNLTVEGVTHILQQYLYLHEIVTESDATFTLVKDLMRHSPPFNSAHSLLHAIAPRVDYRSLADKPTSTPYKCINDKDCQFCPLLNAVDVPFNTNDTSAYAAVNHMIRAGMEYNTGSMNLVDAYVGGAQAFNMVDFPRVLNMMLALRWSRTALASILRMTGVNGIDTIRHAYALLKRWNRPFYEHHFSNSQQHILTPLTLAHKLMLPRYASILPPFNNPALILPHTVMLAPNNVVRHIIAVNNMKVHPALSANRGPAVEISGTVPSLITPFLISPRDAWDMYRVRATLLSVFGLRLWAESDLAHNACSHSTKIGCAVERYCHKLMPAKR
jgi:hypothetical protein